MHCSSSLSVIFVKLDNIYIILYNAHNMSCGKGGLLKMKLRVLESIMKAIV